MVECLHSNARPSSTHAGSEGDTRSTYRSPLATRRSGCTRIIYVHWPLGIVSRVRLKYSSLYQDCLSQRRSCEQAEQAL